MSEGGDSKENETKRYRLVLIIRGGGCRGSIDWGTDGGEVMLIRVKSNFQLLSAGCVRVTGGGMDVAASGTDGVFVCLVQIVCRFLHFVFFKQILISVTFTYRK